MIVIKDNQVFSDSDKYVHRLGTESYFKRSTTLPTDKAEDFEEVDALPSYTESEYKDEVSRLIAERYSLADEIALLNNIKDGTEEHVEEYDEYMAYRDECKAKAKLNLSSRED